MEQSFGFVAQGELFGMQTTLFLIWPKVVPSSLV